MKKWLIIGLLILAVGVSLGLWASRMLVRSAPSCSAEYPLLDDSVGCDDAQPVITKTSYTALQQSLLAYIQNEKSSGDTADIAIFFRDLKDGPVFGINELEDFTPASLLKLPLAFAYLNVADEYPDYLQKELFYTGTSSVIDQNFPPPVSVKAGQPYTLEELLQYMISYSDNGAYQMLNDYLAGDPSRKVLLDQTFQELGIIDPASEDANTVSVRSYASLFRLLYSAAYISPDHSQLLLQWLSDSSFTQGLVAGVPEGVTVAHKFGERSLPDGTKQLHDCGIVYFPENPYILCVMTKGSDWTKLEGVLRTVSQMVYAEVLSRKQN
ncbi:MAG TPA: serine hydrolase [Candidatus Paceibacterota bacterium]|nr:serine hydrolase [Candidatus Paceibacterota bacterium]